MLTISPQPCPLGWMLDDDHQDYIINSFCRADDKRLIETSESIDPHSPSSRTPPQNGESGSDRLFNGDKKTTTKTKKLNHNASERDRRKRINTLYADLRNLLPSDDHSRKLSIPATISRVLKYIPELQKEVEKLIENKERLISKAEDESSFKFKKQKIKYSYNSAAVSATRISDAEIIIQSSMPKSEKGAFSEAILRLEEEGFLIMNASCFESFEGRIFYNFHLQAEEGGQVIDAEKLKEKVWPSI
ncbi:hypothetical protein ACS0TY_024826 [Phlomoides rotata]